MHVLFASMPLPGHLYPMLPLASACERSGHQVSFATGPAMEAEVASLGLAVSVVDVTTEWALPTARERYRELIQRSEPRIEFIAAFFASLIAPAVAERLIPALTTVRPDLVVHEFYNPGAGAAAATLGIPSVSHGLNRLGPPAMLADMDHRLGELWASQGCMRAEAMGHVFGAAYLDICPEAMQDRDSLAMAPRAIPVRPEPYSPNVPLPSALEAPRSRPRVYVTLGTVVNTGERAIRVFRSVVAGVASLPADVVVTVGKDGDPRALAPLPDNVQVERFLPQGRLFHCVDAVVHHCGAGTMFGATAAGLPQLGLPLSTDQFISGAPALTASGAGLVLAGGEITPEHVTTAVWRLLEDTVLQTRAAEVAEEIGQMPKAEDHVPLLEHICLPPRARG